jgi:hypothetical protein
MRHPRPGVLRTAVTVVVLAALPLPAQVIDTGTPPTVPNWPIFPFGRASEVSWASFGQSFVVAAAGPTRLDAFTFWLRDNDVSIGGSTPYHAYIFAWDPATRRTGDTYLFRSALQTYTSAPTPTAFNFVTGGVNLTAGQNYLAVLSSVEVADAPLGLRPGMVVSTAWPNDGYAAGTTFTRPGPAGLATLTGSAWAFAGGVTNGQDFAFRATFSTADGPVPPMPPTTVPEPSTIALMAGGMLGVAMLARRRRPR